MHSSSYQQQNNVSFCSTKQSLLLPFFFQEQTNKQKRTFAPSHARMFESIKKVRGSHRLYKLQGGEMYVHMQAWNAVTKQSNFVFCTGQTLERNKGPGGLTRKWNQEDTKGMTSWERRRRKKKKNSLSGKQFFHHRRLAAVTTKTKTINKNHTAVSK